MDQTTPNKSSSFLLHRSSTEFKKRDSKATVCHSFGVCCFNAQPKPMRKHFCKSDEETLLQLKQSKFLFNEAHPKFVSPMKQVHLQPPSVPATPSTSNTDTTTVTSLSTDDLFTDAFNFALSKIFSSMPMASLTSKDAILKEVKDCVLTDNEDTCRQISPYIHSFWRNLHVKNGCVCIDGQITIPNPIKDAYVEAIHATRPGSVAWINATSILGCALELRLCINAISIFN